MTQATRPTLLQGREVPLGGVRGMSVQRWLPHRTLPTVGAWCFLDRIGPERVDMRVLPHPHTGLQTVTWPLAGRVHHRDSLGSDVVQCPGELNLMTSGPGISHSELSVGRQPLMHAVQLWVALPAGSRTGPRFEQHRDLPVHEAPGLRATVVVGGLAGVASPALVHSPLLGADLVLHAGATAELALDPGFEHALLVLDDLVMWWNFVGRSHDEVAQAREDWETEGQERFGTVPGQGAERIPAPRCPASGSPPDVALPGATGRPVVRMRSRGSTRHPPRR